jgi:hypothetical protein
MATARPFAYNIGLGITGTAQVGFLAVGTPTYGFSATGLEWWNGPDEDLGYVIAQPVPGDTQPTEIPGVFASVGFFRSDALTDPSFINIANAIAGPSGPFASASNAKTWLNANGYWTSYAGATGGTGDFNVTVTQSGSDVVWSGSGSFNLNSLTLVDSIPITSGFNVGQAIWIAGAPTTFPGATGQRYGGASLTYPTIFGSGSPTYSTAVSTGSMFGVVDQGVSGRTITVPDGYVSGTTISGTTTYSSTTIAGLGLSGGTYIWSWGAGANASSLVMIIG